MGPMSHLINEADRARISEAVRLAETRMAAEIVCVVAAGASEYRFTPVLWSSVVALVLPWPLWWFTDIAVGWILGLQLGLFSALLLTLSVKPLRLMLTPRSIQRADVARAAERQFDLLGIMRTQRRAGVLVYVSRAERVAIVLPDERARAVLTIASVEAAVAALTARLRRGALADGYIDAIACLTDAMADKLPPVDGAPNELPDRILEA